MREWKQFVMQEVMYELHVTKKRAQESNRSAKIQVCYRARKSKKRALLSRIAFNKIGIQDKYPEKPKVNIKTMPNSRYTDNPKYSNNTI